MNNIIKLLLFLVFLEYIIFTIIRQCKRYFIYKEAVEYSKKIKKPLLVIGDPDSGWMTRNFGRLYGCGDICTDLYDCPKCKISEKGDILDVFKNKGDNLKLELLEDLEDGKITFYKQGNFTDLCKGPHLTDTSKIKAIIMKRISVVYYI